MGSAEIEQFLTHLAVNRKVASSTQNLALNAVAFLYNTFLERPVGDVSSFRSATSQRKLPVVLTRAEVSNLLSRLQGPSLLMASLLYGSGLCRIELVRLRVRDVDADHLQLRVWFGRDFKHHLTALAPEFIPMLRPQS
jgi:integrase